MRNIQVGPFLVPVRLSTPEEDSDLESHDAYYDTEQIEIVIDETNAQDKRFMSLAHELGHAVCDVHGFALEISDRYKISIDKAEAIEETYLRLFLPTYIAMLTQTGWLKPPMVR